jgi:general stress protein YciG
VSQTKQGGLKVIETNTKKYGSYEAWVEYMHGLSAKGGRAKVPKGFALMTPEQRSEAGTKGGTVSKRRKAKR